MRHLLQEAFDVVEPALASVLVAEPLKEQLRAGLGALAPVLQVGLEMRLGADVPQVDVQQAILAPEGHHRVLARYIERVIAEGGDGLPAAWHRINALVRSWAAGSNFGWLHELWLEYDVTQPLTARALPSVFINVPAELPPAESRALVERTTASLWGRPIPPALRGHLRTCFEAAPNGAWVSHVGMMLARAIDALRVNVKGLKTADVSDLLVRLGWSGPDGAVGEKLDWLLQYADHVTVCLDLGERVYPRVGLEAFFHDLPHEDAGWGRLLDDLVQRGACTPEKRDALLAWVGIDGPPRVSAPWPGELIAQALLKPDRFSTIARRLSHIKVAYQPEQPPEAKAYLGFGPLWGRFASPETSTSTAGAH